MLKFKPFLQRLGTVSLENPLNFSELVEIALVATKQGQADATRGVSRNNGDHDGTTRVARIQDEEMFAYYQMLNLLVDEAFVQYGECGLKESDCTNLLNIFTGFYW